MLWRSSVGFVLSQWRDGERGAVIMGIRHGIYGIGRCGALMLLRAEKLLPGPRLWRRLIAAALILHGLWLGSMLLV